MAITDTGTTGQGTDGPATSEPAAGDEQEQLVAGGGLPPSPELSEPPEPIGPSRRRVIAIASALAIVTIVFLVIAAIIGTTQTEFGRERLRRFLVSRIADRIKGRGTMYIGRIGGSLLTGVTLDSLAIRDEEDSLFVSTGRVVVHYDPRDLWDKRIYVRRLEIEHPVVNFRRHADDVWNFRHIFPSGKGGATTAAQRKLGDYIVIDSVVLRDADVSLTQRWHPPDSLKGARLDSAVRVALADWACTPAFWRGETKWQAQDCGHEIRETKEGLKRTYRWHVRQAVLPYARIADPDSVGRLFVASHMDVDEADPPFPVRDLRGTLRWQGDTAWFDLTHFDLPGSTGVAQGSLRWGGTAPMRYDIQVRGDSVSLADINWVYPTLPAKGGGKMNLHIKNDPRNLDVLDYALSAMDVRAARSHLTGDMTFGVGWPVLVVKDVDLRADPVDFVLLETLSGKPFPVPWAGQLYGTVKARGGPLTQFRVDDARITFRDAHVPGAVAKASGRGGLDILFPAYTKFQAFELNVETFDLRTPQFLFPNFTRLQGTISGSAVLDSSWLDVRFRNADLTHHDGDLPTSHFTGNGRVTDAAVLSYDLDLEADPIDFTSMAHSYPLLPFRGRYVGPMRVRGSLGDMDLATTLSGPAGQVALDGHFDFEAPGYAMRGNAQVQELNVGPLVDRPTLPHTRLNGTMTADLRGDSLANLVGALAIDLGRSRVDTVRLFPSQARLAFGDGRVRVDSLRLESSVATLAAAGAIGVVPGVSDTLRYGIFVDSLGGLRPWLAPPDKRAATKLAAAESTLSRIVRDSLVAAIRDSVGGAVSARGMLVGSLDTLTGLATAGSVAGVDLFVGGDRTRRLDATYTFSGLTTTPSGRVELTLDRPVLFGVRLTSVDGALAVSDPARGRLSMSALSETGPRVATALAYELADDPAGTVRVRLDTLSAQIGERRWALARPATIAADSAGVTMDTLRITDGARGSLTMRGELPTSAPIDFSLEATRLPVADLAALAQARATAGGDLTMRLGVSGTRAAPLMQLTLSTDSLRAGTVRVPNLAATASYAGRRADVQLRFFRDSTPVLTMTGRLPVDLSLVPVDERLPNDSLRGRVSASNVDLSIAEAVAPQYLQRARGVVNTDVDIAGTWKEPTFAGHLTLANGDLVLPKLGIHPRRVAADVGFTRDSITITRIAAVSGERNGSLALEGVVGLRGRDLHDPALRLDVSATEFNVVRNRRLADLDLSGHLEVRGTMNAATVEGAIDVPRGIVYLQDLPQKQLVALADSGSDMVVDTTLPGTRGLLPEASPRFVQGLTVLNLPIRLGEDVWLRSSAANIKLGGEVAVTKSVSPRDASRPVLALNGTLQANRGTYRLDLGLVQRTFEVQGGKIDFQGDTAFDPTLDIAASYTVRQPDQQDIRILATIGGTLSHMQLSLSSDLRYALSQTEILSYLVFGVPTFALGQQGESALRPVAQALLPTLGSALERTISDQIGFIDLVQIQATGLGQEGINNFQTARDYLSGYRIGVGKQLGSRTFVTANAGLCPLAGGTGSNFNLGDILGLTVEHQLGGGLSSQFGVEPAASKLSCNRATRLEINTPKQIHFDLFKEWRF